MNSTTIDYKKKVWQFLDKIKPGVRYSVDKLSKPENREAFIACIKEYMKSLPYDGWINFNSDYSKFYKTDPIPWAQLEEAFKEKNNSN